MSTPLLVPKTNTPRNTQEIKTTSQFDTAADSTTTTSLPIFDAMTPNGIITTKPKSMDWTQIERPPQPHSSITNLNLLISKGQVHSDDSISETKPLETPSPLWLSILVDTSQSWFESISSLLRARQNDGVDEIARRGGLPDNMMRPREDSFINDQRLPPNQYKSTDCQGFIDKLSPWTWLQGWRSRFYILRGFQFLYFASREQLDKPIGVLDFSLVPFQIFYDGDGNHNMSGHQPCCDRVGSCSSLSFGTEHLLGTRCFYLKPTIYPSKVFVFRGADSVVSELVKSLKQVIHRAKNYHHNGLNAMHSGQSYSYECFLSIKNFWRFPYICETDWLGQAETGDILLFKGKETNQRLLRRVTNSSYDHVALILVSSNNTVFLLEATGSFGVSLTPWIGGFKAWKWHQAYKRIAYRKVYFNRNANLLNSFCEWVFLTIENHTQYGLSVDKLLTRKYSQEYTSDGDVLSKDTSDDHTYFCSELVASCLKRLGVIKGARASSTYWPGSFGDASGASSLPLNKGKFIGPELVLIVD